MALPSTEVSAAELREGVKDLMEVPAIKRLFQAGIPLSELGKESVQKALVEATLVEMIADPTDRYEANDRRQAAKDLASMKGFADAGEARRMKLLAEIEQIKRALAPRVIETTAIPEKAESR